MGAPVRKKGSVQQKRDSMVNCMLKQPPWQTQNWKWLVGDGNLLSFSHSPCADCENKVISNERLPSV